MVVTALLVLAGLVSAPFWVLGRVSPASRSREFGVAGTSPAWRAARHRKPSDSARRARTAWRALLVLGVLLLAFAWALGQVIEEARIYAEVHAMPSNVGAPERALRAAVLACAGVLLLGAALLRSSFGARRREA